MNFQLSVSPFQLNNFNTSNLAVSAYLLERDELAHHNNKKQLVKQGSVTNISSYLHLILSLSGAVKSVSNRDFFVSVPAETGINKHFYLSRLRENRKTPLKELSQRRESITKPLA